MRLFGIFFVIAFLYFAQPVAADILPEGHVRFVHQLVFEDSPLFENHRMIASPNAGFSGGVEVTPGKKFHFSSKYGTKLYLVPADEKIDDFDRERFKQFPSCRPPCGQINSIPMYNPVRSAVTTIKFVEVNEDGPVVEVVSHEEFGAKGRSFGVTSHPSEGRAKRAPWLLLTLPLALGVVICCFLTMRKRNVSRQNASLPESELNAQTSE